MSGAHDAFAAAGNAAGNTKISPAATRRASARAALSFAMAAANYSGLALSALDIARALSSGCFVAGTPVRVVSSPAGPLSSTTTGQAAPARAALASVPSDPTRSELATQGIETIQAGMWVAARNSRMGQTEFKQVTHTFQHRAYAIVQIELADARTGKRVDTLRGTPQHPFFTPSGMVAMGDLKPQMTVITRRGPPLVVRSVTREPHPEGILVYNLEIEGDHTYFVGKAEGGTWVHNDCGIYEAELTPGAGGGVTRGRLLTEREVLDRIRRGDDIITGSRSVAKSLAKRASGSNRPIGPEIHGDPADGFLSHFHPDPRNGSHIFYP